MRKQFSKIDNDGYLIAIVDGQIDPLESKLQNKTVYFLEPGFIEEIPDLSQLKSDETYKYNSDSKTFEAVKDILKQVYYHKTTGEEKRFFSRNENPDLLNYTTIKKPDGLYNFDSLKNEWVYNRVERISQIESFINTWREKQISSYRGKVDVDGVSWDAGSQYARNTKTVLENLDLGNLKESDLVTWFDYDNKPNTITITDLKKIHKAIMLFNSEKGNLFYTITIQEKASLSSKTDSELESWTLERLEGLIQ